VASGTTKVPDVRGVPVDEAQQSLSAAGFAVDITEQPTTTTAPGIVINQVPGHDVNAPYGSHVKLFVSVAPPPSVSSSPPVSPPPVSQSPSATASP
jgi:beta-lactam-binding protein with PASTA domain